MNVLHIGAESGEIEFYSELNTKNLVYVEPDKISLSKLYQNIDIYHKTKPNNSINIHVIPKACASHSSQQVTLNANGNGQSSILAIGDRTKQMVGDNFTSYTVETISLTDIILDAQPRIFFDYLCIDTQGYEWEIIKTCSTALLGSTFTFIDIEIMTDPSQYQVSSRQWIDVIGYLLRAGFEPIVHPHGITESYLFVKSEFFSRNSKVMIDLIQKTRDELMHDLLSRMGISIEFNEFQINRYSSLGDHMFLPLTHIGGSIHASLLDKFRKELMKKISQNLTEKFIS